MKNPYGMGTVFAILGYYFLLWYFEFNLDQPISFLDGMIILGFPLGMIPFISSSLNLTKTKLSKLNSLKANLSKEGFSIDLGTQKNKEGLLIDTNSKKIALVTEIGNEHKLDYQYHTISFNQILGSKILFDDSEIVSSKLTSVAGRALIGGLFFGGAGAIVGGVTSATRSVTQIKSMVLEIIIDDIENPAHRVTFFSSTTPIKKGLLTDTAQKEIEYWQTIMELVMLDQDIPTGYSPEKLIDHHKMLTLKLEKEDRIGNEKPVEAVSNGSIEARLEELNNLKAKGIISEESWESKQAEIIGQL